MLEGVSHEIKLEEEGLSCAPDGLSSRSDFILMCSFATFAIAAKVVGLIVIPMETLEVLIRSRMLAREKKMLDGCIDLGVMLGSRTYFRHFFSLVPQPVAANRWLLDGSPAFRLCFKI